MLAKAYFINAKNLLKKKILKKCKILSEISSKDPTNNRIEL